MTLTIGMMRLVASNRPPNPRFDDGDLDVALVEIVEGEGHGHLERVRAPSTVVVFYYEIRLLLGIISLRPDPVRGNRAGEAGVEPRLSPWTLPKASASCDTGLCR